jgi:hypothetical protein
MTRSIRFLPILLLATSLLAAAGCIRSRLLVTSDPSGAAVKIEGKEQGDTPVTVPFTWYWYYKVEVRKDGYEPVTKLEYLRTPPWLLFPLDFFAELIPYPIGDTRHRNYVLKPAPQVEAAPTTGTATAAPTPAPTSIGPLKIGPASAPTPTPAPAPKGVPVQP